MLDWADGSSTDPTQNEWTESNPEPALILTGIVSASKNLCHHLIIIWKMPRRYFTWSTEGFFFCLHWIRDGLYMFPGSICWVITSKPFPLNELLTAMNQTVCPHLRKITMSVSPTLCLQMTSPPLSSLPAAQLKERLAQVELYNTTEITLTIVVNCTLQILPLRPRSSQKKEKNLCHQMMDHKCHTVVI